MHVRKCKYGGVIYVHFGIEFSQPLQTRTFFLDKGIPRLCESENSSDTNPMHVVVAE